MKCPNCSAELNDNARFCPQCGTSVVNDDNPTMVANDEHIPPAYAAPYAPQNGAVAYDPNNRMQQNQNPQNGSKKPLIIAIIALVLVIAISAGVILFVTRKTVGEGELKKAKENYLPPAQAVTIDPTLRDPSNDDIQFKYDDRARISTCTYSVNKMTYDQHYTYDNDQRKLDIETTYREHPIHRIEIPYSAITVPDTFENIEDYYVRLDKDSLAAEETAAPKEGDAPTDASEETPTDPPAEPPTDPPAAPSADWKELYIDFLNSSDVFGNMDSKEQSGKLFYVNDDDTPELVVLVGIGARAASYEFCWISNGEVQHHPIAGAVFTYQERGGRIYTAIGGNLTSGWNKYAFDGSSLTTTHTGTRSAESYSNPVFEYKINDQTVSEEEYSAAMNEADGWSSMGKQDDWTAKTSLPDYIRNY